MWYCKFMFNYPNSIVCKSCTAFCMKRLNERKEMFNFDFKEMNTNGTEGIPEYARSQSSAVNNNIIMEKTYKRVPFDIELAKKIQSGEVEGRIVINEDILDTNNWMLDKNPVNSKIEILWVKNNVCIGSLTDDNELFIELQEEAPKHEFKVGDKVRVNYPKERLTEMMINGCYQGKILTVNQVTDYCVRASSDEVKENCFTFDEIEPYEEKHEFKPFDKVLVRKNNKTPVKMSNGDECSLSLMTWTPAIYQRRIDGNTKYQYLASGILWRDCILYEGNEHLAGTTGENKIQRKDII